MRNYTLNVTVFDVYLSFWSRCHWGAKVIQVPNVDFRLVPSGRHQICLRTQKNVNAKNMTQMVEYSDTMSNLTMV